MCNKYIKTDYQDERSVMERGGKGQLEKGYLGGNSRKEMEEVI